LFKVNTKSNAQALQFDFIEPMLHKHDLEKTPNYTSSPMEKMKLANPEDTESTWDEFNNQITF